MSQLTAGISKRKKNACTFYKSCYFKKKKKNDSNYKRLVCIVFKRETTKYGKHYKYFGPLHISLFLSKLNQNLKYNVF